MPTREISLMRGIAEAVREHVGSAFVVLKARIEQAEKRIADVPSGARGEKGEKGDPGESVVGEKGEKGEKGDPGESAVGQKGDKGDSGESIVGPKGDTGDRGETGIGERGEKGDKGDAGESIVGPKGDKGDSGERGETGIGERGEKGDKGDAGESIIGPRGEKGDSGERGEKGYPGGIGEAGPIGEKGLDAYQLAADDGFVGTRRQWLDSLVGKNGEPGRDGRDAVNGKDGEHGRDALQIDILDSLDVTRSYARGTYAKYGGGIVHATRVTEPIGEGSAFGVGWRFVIDPPDSLCDLQIEQEADERTITFRGLFTSGKVVEKVVTFPVMIYRQVWKEGVEYQRGDQITWDGSTWHCNETTMDKPGTSQAWRLCAKKGRDGKDGVGIKGDPGPPGKPGRDGGKY